MTSRRLWREHADTQIDMLVRMALRERVAGRTPSQEVWARTTERCACAQYGLRFRLLRWMASMWMTVMNWSVPLFDVPVGRWNEQRLVGQNVHWTWLSHHKVNVRLAC